VFGPIEPLYQVDTKGAETLAPFDEYEISRREVLAATDDATHLGGTIPYTSEG
jgi:hypothetical protein